MKNAKDRPLNRKETDQILRDVYKHAEKNMLKNKPKAAAKAPKHNYKELWKGMPEFVQESAMPIKQIVVGFASNEDILKFSKLVGQVISPKTRSIWYPKLENKPIFNKRWSDKQPKGKKK